MTEAGYPNGFEISIICWAAWHLEAKIIAKMLERVGLKVRLDVLTRPEYLRRVFIPLMVKPPEDQEWDLALDYVSDWYGHLGASFFPYHLKNSTSRYILHDVVYDDMYHSMASTLTQKAQENKIRRLGEYAYDKAYFLYVYSPVTLYAVNREVNLVPQKSTFLVLKETSVTENHWSVRGKSN